MKFTARPDIDFFAVPVIEPSAEQPDRTRVPIQDHPYIGKFHEETSAVDFRSDDQVGPFKIESAYLLEGGFCMKSDSPSAARSTTGSSNSERSSTTGSVSDTADDTCPVTSSSFFGKSPVTGSPILQSGRASDRLPEEDGRVGVDRFLLLPGSPVSPVILCNLLLVLPPVFSPARKFLVAMRFIKPLPCRFAVFLLLFTSHLEGLGKAHCHELAHGFTS